MKKLIKILIILGIIISPFIYGYYIINNRIEKNRMAEEERINTNKSKSRIEQLDPETLRKKQVEAEKEAIYSNCLNKAYNDYRTKYDEECSKFIMDGQCSVSDEKRYELDGIYMHEKEQCEKIKP